VGDLVAFNVLLC